MDRLKKVQLCLDDICADAIFVKSSANVRYLSGFNGEGYLLILKDKSFLITDSRYTEHAIRECQDFEIIEYMNFYKDLAKLVENNKIKTLAIEESCITYSQYKMLSSNMCGINSISSGNIVEKLRQKKDINEIKNIERAVEISDKAFEYILKFLKPGVSEKDVSIELEYFMKKNGATMLAFDTIVAFGERTSMPHAVPTDRILKDRDICLMDYGCVYNGYCSDMTRVVFVGGISDEERKVYDIVLEAQRKAIDKICAGLKGSFIDNISRKYIYDNGFEGRFGHSLGHSVGLEVHETPAFSPKDETILENGMVITVEPGIYLPQKFGVRIEDMVLVNNEECKILTNSSKDIIILK